MKKNLFLLFPILLSLFSCELVKPKNNYIEIRIAPTKINTRTGPGINFSIDSSGNLVAGEKLYVLEDNNGWIRFRVTPEDIGWSGWIKKDLTITEQDWLSKQQIKADKEEEKRVKYLSESGLLLEMNPQYNEVFVNPLIWMELDFRTKEGIGKTLAFYCGRKKNTNLNWVDIKDGKTG